MSTYETLGAVKTQEESFPFVEFILPSDFDQAKKALQAILDARWPGGIFSLDAWRYIGIGGDAISGFLKHYLLYAREVKDFITPVTFSSFKTAMRSRWPDLPDDSLTEWLNAVIEAQKQGSMPDTILKPWLYVPEDVTVSSIIGKGILPIVEPQLNKIILVAGAVVLIYFLGKDIIGKKLIRQS